MSRRFFTLGVCGVIGVILLQYLVWSNVPYLPWDSDTNTFGRYCSYLPVGGPVAAALDWAAPAVMQPTRFMIRGRNPRHETRVHAIVFRLIASKQVRLEFVSLALINSLFWLVGILVVMLLWRRFAQD